MAVIAFVLLNSLAVKKTAQAVFWDCSVGFQIGISENFGLCPERTPINCRNPYNKNRTFIADFLQRYRKQNKFGFRYNRSQFLATLFVRP